MRSIGPRRLRGQGEPLLAEQEVRVRLDDQLVELHARLAREVMRLAQLHGQHVFGRHLLLRAMLHDAVVQRLVDVVESPADEHRAHTTRQRRRIGDAL